MESLELEDKLKSIIEDFEEPLDEVADKIKLLEDKNYNLEVKFTAI